MPGVEPQGKRRKEGSTLPIQAVETQRLYQQVAHQLGELIRRGELAVGQRLPPERDLARQLGVSRPIVREAMVALEIAGLVEVRTGSGIYVRKGASDARQPFVLPDVGPSPFELIGARKLIEPEIACAAARTLTQADLDAIAGTLDDLRQAVAAGRDIKAVDRLFHVRIAAATRNAVLASIVDQLWEQVSAPLYAGLRRRADLPEHHHAALLAHTRVFEAMQRRDGAAARDAMRAHLEQAEALLMEGDAAA